MSGMSSNLNSIFLWIPPTWPVSGSKIEVKKVAPVVSVAPYPSWIGTHRVILRYFKTSSEIGAPPVAALGYENLGEYLI